MKKAFLILLVCVMASTSAFAHGGHRKPKLPPNPPHHHTVKHNHNAAGIILGTIAGITLLDAIATAGKTEVAYASQPKVYIAEPKNKCYTVVSRKKGTVSHKCVNSTEDEIIYVD